jgi:hypothetical protein
MIGRLKASRTAGETERRAAAAATRNLNLREKIGVLICSETTGSREMKRPGSLELDPG